MIDTELLTLIYQDLERDEGNPGFAYDDATGKRVHAPQGNLTIGIGHNLDARPLPDDVVSFLLQKDVEIAVTDCIEFFGQAFGKLSSEQKRGLINFSFNVGLPVMRKFLGLKHAITTGDRRAAALSIMNSKYRTQVGQRAERIARLLEG